MSPSSRPPRRAPLVAALAAWTLTTAATAPVASAAPVPTDEASVGAAIAAAQDDGPGVDDSWPAPVVRVSVEGQRATVTWDGVGDETHLVGYLVDHAETGADVQVAVGQPRSATFALVGGTNTFMVVPVTVQEKLATPGTASVLTDATAPQPPLGLSVARAQRDVTIGWWAPGHDGGSALTHYVVRIGEREWTVPAGGSPQLTLRAGTDLLHGTTSAVSVVAVNAVGASVAATSTVQTAPQVLPSAPRNLKVTSTLRSGKAQHVVSWSAPAVRGDLGITQWEVTVGATRVKVASRRTSWTVKNTPGGVTAAVSVRAINADGPGAQATVSTRTKKQKPSRPRQVRASNGSTRTAAVKVRWRVASEAGTGQQVRYQVKAQRLDARGRAVGKVVSVRTVRRGQLSRTVRVPRAGRYRVSVRVVTEHGNSRWSTWTRTRITG